MCGIYTWSPTKSETNCEIGFYSTRMAPRSITNGEQPRTCNYREEAVDQRHGDSCLWSHCPVPESGTSWGLPPPLSVTCTLAERAPVAVGVKVTVMVQVLLAGTLEQLLV